MSFGLVSSVATLTAKSLFGPKAFRYAASQKPLQKRSFQKLVAGEKH